MNVPAEILRQLGGNKFVVMTGAKDFVGDGNTLRMSLPKNKSGANRLYITLNGNDLYDMKFFHKTNARLDMKTMTWKEEKISKVVEYHDIFCDQLQEIFTNHTWMYTHL